jgi:2-dehydropantoate 2-reductase
VIVYVVGAGAVGTYLGQLLAARGSDVVYAPRAIDDVRPLQADLAIVGVKAYDVDGAIATLRRALGERTGAAILCPQNGVGAEEKLAAAFGADNIVSCALTVPVGKGPDGRAVAANAGGIAFAPVGTVAHNWLIAAFGGPGAPPVRAVADYRALKWSKLALNIVANATCAILDVLPERLVRMPDVFALELRALGEAREAMRAMGLRPIDLPRYPVRALFAAASLPPPIARALLARRIAGARGKKPPSLLLDLRNGRGNTEVEALNGAIAQAGRAYGVPTPVNAMLARVLGEIARDARLWERYREKPEALLAEAEAVVREKS